MGNGCDPKNLLAITRAEGQMRGDFFSEAERVKNFDGEQRFFYENHIANSLGINLKKPNKVSVYDAMGRLGIQKGNGKTGLGKVDRLLTRPSEVFSKKFYSAIEKNLLAWQSGKADLESFQEKIAAPARKTLSNIDKAIKEASSTADLNKRLDRFGLDTNTVYDARQWLRWLGEGGHLKSGDEVTQFLKKPLGNLAKAQANLNFLWTGGNFVDMIRVVSHYSTQPGGVENIMKGLSDLKKATGGNIFKMLPQLKKEGIYGSDHIGAGTGKLDLFGRSIIAQKNLAYYIDKAAGGDGYRGVRDLVFDSKPWDQPIAFRDPAANLIFGLARFPINETRWYFKTVRQAVGGSKRAQANLLLYAATKALFVGTAATFIPAPLLPVLYDKDKRAAIRKWEKGTGINLVSNISGDLLKQAGIDSEIDLSGYASPLGGKLGIRPGMLTDTIGKVASRGGKSVVNLTQGKPGAAALNALASASALMNLTGYTKGIQALEMTNSTTLTKMYEAAADNLSKEFNRKKLSGDLVKAAFGARNVKKTDAQ